MYNTASPENGAVSVLLAPPLTVPPLTVVPFDGLNHSTVSVPEAPPRLTVIDPPLEVPLHARRGTAHRFRHLVEIEFLIDPGVEVGGDDDVGAVPAKRRSFEEGIRIRRYGEVERELRRGRVPPTQGRARAEESEELDSVRQRQEPVAAIVCIIG